jgi:hypothetical protein
MFGAKHRAEQKAAAEEARTAELRQALVNLIALAQGDKRTEPDGPLVLRSGERLVWTLEGAGLFEPRRQPGHWSGRSAGVSVPVPDTRLRVRVGKSAGTYVQGAESPTVIDTGQASITSERVVFQGGKYTRDWEFTKLIGVIHYSDHPATAIQVSNREKTSGLVYPASASPEPVRLAITVAIAIFHGEIEETIKELRGELATLDDRAPSPATDESPPDTSTGDQDPAQPGAAPGRAPSSPANPTKPVPMGQPESSTVPPPMWAGDPSRRHQWRYWDGKSWTEFVNDNGQQSRDPLPD